MGEPARSEAGGRLVPGAGQHHFGGEQHADLLDEAQCDESAAVVLARYYAGLQQLSVRPSWRQLPFLPRRQLPCSSLPSVFCPDVGE